MKRTAETGAVRVVMETEVEGERASWMYLIGNGSRTVGVCDM